MARYNRINLDGKSKTMTAVVKDRIQYGEVVILNADGEFIEAQGDTTQQLFILGGMYNQGHGTDDFLEAGNTAVGEYIESGRKLAVRAEMGQYKVGDPLSVSAGTLIPSSTGAEVVAYAAENVDFDTEQFLAVSIK